MSWTVHLVDNDLVITKKCALELVPELIRSGRIKEVDDKDFDDDYKFIGNPRKYVEQIWDKKTGFLIFDPDDREHIDYLSEESVQKIIYQHTSNGHVYFADFEGDRHPKMWGYIFLYGYMTKMTGRIDWTPIMGSRVGVE